MNKIFINFLRFWKTKIKEFEKEADVFPLEDAEETEMADSIELLKFVEDNVRNNLKEVVQLIRTWNKEAAGKLKSAYFIIAVDSEISAGIFKYLNEDEVEKLISEIVQIKFISAEQKNTILRDFYNRMITKQFISIGGIGYAKEVLEKALGQEKSIETINRFTSKLHTHPFEFIRHTDPYQLLNFIQQEHPQTIAVVLSYLEPNKASIILQKLSNEVQSDVAQRIAEMDRANPEILREVERVLEKKLSTLSSEDYIKVGGVESITEILNLFDRASEKRIIEALEDEAPELAEEIKKRMFIFEDIITLDDRAIQKVMREIDSQELARALKGVDSEVQNKIFNNMSKRAADMLKEDMEYMGRVRLKDVEETRQKIVSVIRHLEDTGEIIVACFGDDEMVE